MRNLLAIGLAFAGCGSAPRRAADVPDASVEPDSGPEPDAGPEDDAGGCADADGDGHLPIACGGDDCDDGDDAIHPGADTAEVAREWEIDLLDLQEGATAITVDEDDVAHVIYLGTGGDDGSDLVHATRDGDGWETETIDDIGETGHCPSVVLADGTFHVAYCEVFGGSLLYATGPDPWEIELVTSTGINMVGSTEIALGADGFPRIAFHEEDTGLVRLATRDDAGWSVETIRITAAGAISPSLAIDANGVPHVAWVDYALYDARREAGGWIIDVVDDLAGEGPTGHVVDSTGLLQLFYTERTVADDRSLARASWRDGIWEREMVDDQWAARPRAVAGPAGRVLVAYEAGISFFSVGDDLRGAWQVEEVAPGVANEDLSFARDSRGGLHVSTSIGRSGHRSGGQLVPQPHARYAYRPGADGIDQNRDGIDGIDEDGDGHASLVSFGGDCDDSEIAVHPGLADPPGGGDLDCDGVP